MFIDVGLFLRNISTRLFGKRQRLETKEQSYQNDKRYNYILIFINHKGGCHTESIQPHLPLLSTIVSS